MIVAYRPRYARGKVYLLSSVDGPERYWFQPWWRKLWRRRHQLWIPYQALYSWLHPENRKLSFKMTFSNCWSLAIGLADGRMGRWFTSEECHLSELWREADND